MAQISDFVAAEKKETDGDIPINVIVNEIILKSDAKLDE